MCDACIIDIQEEVESLRAENARLSAALLRSKNLVDGGVASEPRNSKGSSLPADAPPSTETVASTATPSPTEDS